MDVAVPLNRIIPSKYEPERRLEGPRDELRESIRERGILQTPVGRPMDADGPLTEPIETEEEFQDFIEASEDHEVMLACGHRRWMCKRDLADEEHGLMEVDVKPLTDTELMTIQDEENRKRGELSYVEEAEQIKRMKEDHTLAEIKEALGVSNGTIYDRLALMDFPTEVRTEIDAESSDLNVTCALEIHELWTLSDEEIEYLEMETGLSIDSLRRHMLDVARKEPSAKVEEEYSETVAERLDNMSQEGAGTFEVTPEDTSAPSSTGNNSTREEEAPNESRARDDDSASSILEMTEAKKEAVTLHVDSTLPAGEYVIGRESGTKDPDSSIGDEERKATVRIADQIQVQCEDAILAALVEVAFEDGLAGLLQKVASEEETWKSEVKSIVQAHGGDLVDRSLE